MRGRSMVESSVGSVVVMVFVDLGSWIGVGYEADDMSLQIRRDV